MAQGAAAPRHVLEASGVNGSSAGYGLAPASPLIISYCRFPIPIFSESMTVRTQKPLRTWELTCERSYDYVNVYTFLIFAGRIAMLAGELLNINLVIDNMPGIPGSKPFQSRLPHGGGFAPLDLAGSWKLQRRRQRGVGPGGKGLPDGGCPHVGAGRRFCGVPEGPAHFCVRPDPGLHGACGDRPAPPRTRALGLPPRGLAAGGPSLARLPVVSSPLARARARRFRRRRCLATAMAVERLFSLELLVDWVRLEAAPPPDPAVAFRLLDFPPLLVRAPARPAALPGGALGFGRGKACVFRLRPAALRRPRLRAALLQLPAAPGPPAPRLLGACDVPLPAARGPGSRGTFVLLVPAGRRIGDLVLFCRLTELGGRARDPADPAPAALGARDPADPAPAALGARDPADPAPARGPRDTIGPALGARDHADPVPAGRAPDLGPQDAAPAALDPAAAQEGALSPARAGSAENSKPGPAEAADSSVSTVSTSSVEDAELDLEINTFCPPPLYYTHLTQERRLPAGVKITIEPQRDEPEELGDALPEKVLVNPPTHLSPPKGTDSATQETPAVLLSPPGSQDVGAVNESTCCPQTEQNTINTIRQLPLLNALLIELSLLYNQPVASPTHVHPHLAWLYRTEDKKVPESCAKSTSESKKDKFSVGDHEKSVSLQCKKNQVENLKKGKYFENSGDCQKRVTRGRLLYGLTNTLRLRLKQTNPDMLVVHEKREEYRKMQAQTWGTSTKFRIPSSKVKVLSFAEQSQKPHQLPSDKYLDSDASSAENGDTSRQISEVFDEPSTTKETKLKCTAERKTTDCAENRTGSGSLGRIMSPAESIIPERLTPANILEGKLETRVQNPCVFQEDAVADRIVNKEIDDWQVRTTDIDVPAEMSENSCHESISELKYSDDFTSPCYSEEFTTEENSKSLQTHDSSPRAEISHNSKSSGARPPSRKSSSEKSSVLSPPFSAGSPVLSQKRRHLSKTRDKSVEKASSNSTSNLSSSHRTEEKESQIDQVSRHNSKGKKQGQDFPMKLKAETGCEWSEKSPSPRTSQVSSYLPSNLSELEFNVLDGSTSDHFEEEDDIGSLRISKQYKDICELVINKLPGYTV
ncbi:microtubule-associated protein 10 [Sciurus carolinensis]|uniref:microtubule-associated protein 10 n=1 Tax=Sciurus carolinensis TaxID=30640 RepID=UPI001FB4BA8A|nr:microtubule-associated protein 10 [Sciurus carolinensis]